MTLTKDKVKIEALFQAFFTDVFSRDHLHECFANLDKIISINYRDPEIKFVIVCKPDSTKFVPNADGEFNPDITITMDWETAHHFWMDDLDILSAVLNRKIVLGGNFADLYNLRPLFKETSSIYQKLAMEYCEADGTS
jgi:hypothetical protein